MRFWFEVSNHRPPNFPGGYPYSIAYFVPKQQYFPGETEKFDSLFSHTNFEKKGQGFRDCYKILNNTKNPFTTRGIRGIVVIKL